MSRRRLVMTGVSLAVAAVVLYIGATVASAIDYNTTEAAGLPIDGPPLWILILAWSAQGLGIAGVVVVLVALVLNTRARRSAVDVSR